MSGAQPGWRVYVISIPDGPQKIGITRDVQRRLALLQTASPHRLTLTRSLSVGSKDEARAVERRAHLIFRARRMTGEWFEASPEEAVSIVERALEEHRRSLPLPEPAPVASKLHVSSVANPVLLRAGRRMVGWTQGQLAEAAGLSLAVVNNVERNVTDPRRSTLEAIQRALESGGVEFIGERQNSPDGGAGVRMRRG